MFILCTHMRACVQVYQDTLNEFRGQPDSICCLFPPCGSQLKLPALVLLFVLKLILCVTGILSSKRWPVKACAHFRVTCIHTEEDGGAFSLKQNSASEGLDHSLCFRKPPEKYPCQLLIVKSNFCPEAYLCLDQSLLVTPEEGGRVGGTA